LAIETQLPKHFRRNFWCLVLDFAFFGIGLAFISPGTVVPSFLTTLGASSAVIGLVSTLQRASWLLPQLIAARYMADKPRQKPYILWPAAVSRGVFLVFALLLFLSGGKPAWLIILLTAVVVVAFWVGDGLASVPWFELLSKVIPPTRRGRMTGIAQVISGSMGLLVGIAVEWMLSPRGPSFPRNYVLLFVLGTAMLTISVISLSMVREARGRQTSEIPSWREFMPQLWRVLRRDRVYREYVISRQVFGLSGLAAPFYMTYAIDVLDLPAQVAGRYTSIGVIGSILAAVLFAWVSERSGSKRVMMISIVLNATVPLLALAIPQVFSDPFWLAWAYGLIFLTYNAVMNSFMPGWMNYVLEHAPEAERPTYVGLTNTLNGFTTLFSTVGGVFLTLTGDNYNVLFTITFLGVVMAWPLAVRLPEPRHASAAVERAPA
jgi:MFS family permease